MGLWGINEVLQNLIFSADIVVTFKLQKWGSQNIRTKTKHSVHRMFEQKQNILSGN